MSKQHLRSGVSRSRVSRSVSAAIQHRLLAQDWWAAVFVAGLYRAKPDEPGTELLLADLLARGMRVAVPARRGRGYGWAEVEASTRWRAGAHGIPEPARIRPVTPAELRVVVVPGLAFDVRGGRLGHGQGHFDRLLADSGALMVGLCPECRLVAEVPQESHDIPMDAVVTEKRIVYAAGAAAKIERIVGTGGRAGSPEQG